LEELIQGDARPELGYWKLAGWPTFSLLASAAAILRLPLDKSEGVVKDKDLLCSAEHRVFARRLRTKTLEISR